MARGAMRSEGIGRASDFLARNRSKLDPSVALVGIAAFFAGTEPLYAARYDGLLTGCCLLVSGLFGVEWALDVWGSRAGDDGSARGWRDSFSRAGLADLLATVPVPLALALGASHLDARIFGIFWSLKLIRASPALALLGRVLRNERHSLFSVTGGFTVVLLFAATLGFLLERHAQPEAFASIPASLWWAVVTLTTTGYGDKIPATLGGRILAGAVMVCGIGLFALWAGILSSGFAHELRRSEFLKAWDLVVQHPLFRGLHSAAINEITRALKVRDFTRGSLVVRKGEPGDSMFFIVDGEVQVLLPDAQIALGPGKFFGEMALVQGGPRSADVRANGQVRLLRLDVVDFRELAARNPDLLAVIEAESRKRASAPA